VPHPSFTVLFDRGSHLVLRFAERSSSLCNGQRLIFPKTVICLTSIGAAPGRHIFKMGRTSAGWSTKPIATTFIADAGRAALYRQLAVESGHLRFYIENQGVYEWSTLPHGDDPPVFGPARLQAPMGTGKLTLSEHLILVCLFEALISHAQIRGIVSVAGRARNFAESLSRIPPLAVGPWR